MAAHLTVKLNFNSSGSKGTRKNSNNNTQIFPGALPGRKELLENECLTHSQILPATYKNKAIVMCKSHSFQGKPKSELKHG